MQLYPHQSEALVQSKAMNRVAYYWDMGLGKTFVGGEKLVQLGARINLVVCQKSKVQDWVDHLKKFYDYPGNLESGCYPYQVIDLTTWKTEWFDDDEKFITDLVAGQIIYVINYDLLFRRDQLLSLKRFTLLLDESSLIQNEKAKRSKFVLKMNPANVILLSGTPVSGKYENLWSQIHLLGWPISNDLYNRQYVNWETVEINGFPMRRVNPENPYRNVDRLKAKLREHGAFFLKTEECFTLPTQNFVTVHIPTIPQYRKFRKHKVVIAPDGSELIGDTTLTERLYSRQLCGHYNQHKVQAFIDLLNSTNERLIVFYNFNAELAVLIEAVKAAERPLSFVNGHVKDLTAYEEQSDSVTLIQYQAGAMGLNLQKANKVIYFTLTDKSELFEQSKKRIHRIGQNLPCFYYLLICKNSVEELVLKTLEQRRDFTDELFKESEV